jgi:uncharacterized protein (TIGR03382 family)
MRSLGLLMIALAIALPMLAQGPVAQAPEIDAGSAIAAVALLSGGLVVLRARRKK